MDDAKTVEIQQWMLKASHDIESSRLLLAQRSANIGYGCIPLPTGLRKSLEGLSDFAGFSIYEDTLK